MAELVGVVAASSQLASSCLSLLELAKKIKEAPSALQNYQTQLQELHHLSLSISQNPLLQTQEVGIITHSLKALIEKSCLKSLLGRNRLHRSIGFLLKEKDLAALLGSLERHKSHLSLVIQNIEARTLHQIHNEIKTMAKPFNNVEGRRVPPDSNENASDFDQQDSVPTSPVSIAPDAVAVVSRKYQSHASSPREDESDYDYDGNYDTPNQTEDKARVQSGLSDEEHRRGLNLGIEFGGEATYYGNYAGPGVDQINGPDIKDDTDLLNRLVEPQSASTPTRTTGNPFDSPRTVYMGSIKTGSGIQLNGLHATYSGTLMGIPRVSAHYSGCVLAAEYDNSGKPTRQSQHNGPYLRKLRRGDGGSSQGNGMHGKN